MDTFDIHMSLNWHQNRYRNIRGVQKCTKQVKKTFTCWNADNDTFISLASKGTYRPLEITEVRVVPSSLRRSSPGAAVPQPIPAGTWRVYNVALTSMQRHDVVSTLIRHYFNVVCLLGSYLDFKIADYMLHFRQKVSSLCFHTLAKTSEIVT